MIAEIGHFALALALAIALFQSVVPLVGASKGWTDWMRAADSAATLQFLATALAFAALVHGFVTSDFSLRIVYENSHSAKPMLFKVTGTWGNHEGSMLLWVLILTLFGGMVAWFGRGLPLGLRARALAVQAMIGFAFLAFIITTSNPFDRMLPAPLDGTDLNPLLQDIGLAIHPPFLYLGYVGLSMAFSFAVAALIEGRVDAAWARWVRPWTLAAWMFLTIGIALGSYWAYYELGWGGWWFWDPVENVSFMPWLVAAALLHSTIVVEKRSSMQVWTILLAILAFSLSLIGTFIVRSGLLTSVHAFATDPTRGEAILVMLACAIGGSLALFALRAPSMPSEGYFRPVSREGALILNNLLLAVATAVVFAGTLAPMVREAFDGTRISVGPPFFDLAFTPFMMVLFAALPVGSLLPWKRGDLGRTMGRLWLAALASVALGALAWALGPDRGGLVAPVGFLLAGWLVFGALTDLFIRAGGRRFSPARLFGLPRADWGRVIAHAGLGLSVMGIAAISAWETEDIRVAKPGDAFEVAGYAITFDDVEQGRGPNYAYERGHFTVRSGGVEVAQVHPEKRVYPVQRMPTTEAGIDSGLTRDVYLTIGDRQEVDGVSGWAVRTYIKPFANWIWIGCFVMAFGGALSLSDRRIRVGASARRPAAAGVPAE